MPFWTTPVLRYTPPVEEKRGMREEKQNSEEGFKRLLQRKEENKSARSDDSHDKKSQNRLFPTPTRPLSI
jgi:hypothetical protein